MKRTPKIPGPLYIIAGLLVISALVRVPILATEAMALDGTAMSAPLPEKPKADTAQIDVLLQQLQARKEAIETRERELDAKASKLAEMERRVSAKIADLTEAEQNLRNVLAIADSAAEDDVARLTTVYENMKPKDAASVFEKMPPAFASGFLSRMRPDAAASIMAGLNPETAYAISVVLAGRHVEQDSQ